MAASYTVTYNCGDGSGSAPASQTVERNASVITQVNTCTPPSGRLFANWLISGTSTKLKENVSFKYEYSANKTLTAQYADYIVTYSCGIGSGSAPESAFAVASDSFTPATKACTPPTGYKFSGWLVSGTNDIKSAGTAFTWTYTQNKTFTAQYTGLTIGLTWDGSASPASCTYGGGLNPPVKTKTGYVFSGWKVKKINASTTCNIETFDTYTNGIAWGSSSTAGSLCNRCSSYGLKKGANTNHWATEFDHGVIYGQALCGKKSGTYATEGNSGASGGQYCWCKLVGYTAFGNSYTSGPKCKVSTSVLPVFNSTTTSYSQCTNNCGSSCAKSVNSSNVFRAAVFGVVGQ